MKIDKPIETRKVSTVASMIEDAYRGSSLKEGPRPYIGASILGHPCDRYIWLNFRWVLFYQLPHEGKMELLFQRGRDEEKTVIKTLRKIGLHPVYVLDDQMNLDFGCHVKGHPDGIIPEGIPEAPKTPHNLEIKTHNDKSFKDLVDNGVEISKPQHYAQMQLEMYGEYYLNKEYKCNRSLYYAVNKNNDDRYTERIDLDKEYAESLIERGHRLALEDEMPALPYIDPDCKTCRYCAFKDYCHGDRLPEVNCRTCCHSTAKEDGTWYCDYWKDTIPEEAQRKGCDAHVIHPELVKDWTFIRQECKDWSAMFYTSIGKVLNGIDGCKTKDIMRKILAKEGKDASYLDYEYKEPEPDSTEGLPVEDVEFPF